MTEYALRLSSEEITRYRRMAEAARAHEADLWTTAGMVAGAHIVDLGCGPGAALLAMAEVVGPDGCVDGVDGDPAAVAAATALIEAAGLANARVRLGDVADSGLEPGSADVVVLRHVLAHNGRTEQAIVDHAAALVRPGGCVYLVDIDADLFRSRPRPALVEEVAERYRAYHAARGNDLLVGLRLTELLERAGLQVVVDDLRTTVMDLVPGIRPPAWAAREDMVRAGIVTAEDIERWSKGFAELDAAERPLRGYFPFFVAAGRRPA